jgi:putative FmdB family regulatory protein
VIDGRSKVPQFDMKCRKCGKEFVFFKVRSDEEPQCPYCASQDAEKLVSKSTSFQLKGGRWAKDKYGK